MYLIRAGRRTFNLEYLVLAEEKVGDDGGALVVTIVTGRDITLSGTDAEEFRRGLAGALAPPSAPAEGGAGAVAEPLDPATGQPLRAAPVDE